MKTINYLFNVEKFVKNVALIVQSLNKYLQHENEKFTGLKKLVFGQYSYPFDSK
jgi:hypothetical protein